MCLLAPSPNDRVLCPPDRCPLHRDDRVVASIIIPGQSGTYHHLRTACHTLTRGFGSEAGRIFREAWIAGVKRHYPGGPKPGYIAPWEETPDWERESAAAVYEQVHAFVELSNGHTAKLTREQKGRFIATCWIAQIYKHIPEPKPAYVADWTDLPEWQRETDADIFEWIEREM